jgi:hypothetical protein
MRRKNPSTGRDSLRRRRQEESFKPTSTFTSWGPRWNSEAMSSSTKSELVGWVGEARIMCSRWVVVGWQPYVKVKPVGMVERTFGVFWRENVQHIPSVRTSLCEWQARASIINIRARLCEFNAPN